MSKPMTLTDAVTQAHRANNQLRGLCHTLAGLDEKLAKSVGWGDLKPEAQTRKRTEALANLIAEGQAHIDQTRAHAQEFLAGAEERLAPETYLRNARHSESATDNVLHAILWELRTPKLTFSELHAVMADALARGDERGAAELHVVRRELAARTIDTANVAEGDARTFARTATAAYPLPPAIAAEREQIEELRRTARAVESAWGALASGGQQPDMEEKIERWTAGEVETEPATPAPPPERVLPFMVARDDQSKSAA